MLPKDLSQPHVGPTLGWAHMVGAIFLDAERERCPDPGSRAELEDLATRFCWALDERRPDILVDCLTEGIVWEGSVAGSQALGPLVGRDEYLAWQRRIWDDESGTQPRHLLLNTLHTRGVDDAPGTCSYLSIVTSRGETHRSPASGFISISYRGEPHAWRIDRIFQGWDAPPWRRGPAEMTGRERRLHLIREADGDE
jgi:hypothetical protein